MKTGRNWGKFRAKTHKNARLALKTLPCLLVIFSSVFCFAPNSQTQPRPHQKPSRNVVERRPEPHASERDQPPMTQTQPRLHRKPPPTEPLFLLIEILFPNARPIGRHVTLRLLVEQSTFPDSVPEFGTFFRGGLLRRPLTDGNGIAFLVFAIGGSDNGP